MLPAEILKVLAVVDWLVEIGAYLGSKCYSIAVQSAQEFMVRAGLHEEVVKTALLHSQTTRRSMQRGLQQNNPFLLRCVTHLQEFGAYLELVARQTIATDEPGSAGGSNSNSYSNSNSNSNSDFQVLLGGEEASPIPTQASMFASRSIGGGAGAPTTGGSAGASAGAAKEKEEDEDEDPQYKEVLRNLAKFQATSSDDSPSLVPPTTAVGISTPTEENAQSLTPPIKASGGFNFAAASTTRPVAPKHTSTISNTSSTTTSSVSMLDAFDVPAAPVRRQHQRDTRTNGSSGGRTATGTLDLLGDGFDALPPPPTRTSRRPLGVALSSLVDDSTRRDVHMQPPVSEVDTSSTSPGEKLEAVSAQDAVAVKDTALMSNIPAGDGDAAPSALDLFPPASRTIRINRTLVADQQTAPSDTAAVAPSTATAATTTTTSPAPAPALTPAPAAAPARSVLDDFDSFAAPVRHSRRQAPAPQLTAVAPASSALISALDAFDSFGPPARPRRKQTPMTAVAAGAAPPPAPTAPESAPVQLVDPSTMSTTNATRVAPVVSALDAFDSFDSFVAPARHTRAGRPVRASAGGPSAAPASAVVAPESSGNGTPKDGDKDSQL